MILERPCYLTWQLGTTTPGVSRRLRDPDRQKVVYAAAAPVVVMPRSWKRVCMLMRRVS